MKRSKLTERTILELSPYFPDLDLRKIEIITGIPWYVPMSAIAYTDRNKIYISNEALTLDSPEGLALIAHELAHVEQYEKFGKWRFRLLYSKSWLFGLMRNRSFDQAYHQNRYEAAARTAETKVFFDLCNRSE